MRDKRLTTTTTMLQILLLRNKIPPTIKCGPKSKKTAALGFGEFLGNRVCLTWYGSSSSLHNDDDNNHDGDECGHGCYDVTCWGRVREST